MNSNEACRFFAESVCVASGRAQRAARYMANVADIGGVVDLTGNAELDVTGCERAGKRPRCPAPGAERRATSAAPARS